MRNEIKKGEEAKNAEGGRMVMDFDFEDYPFYRKRNAEHRSKWLPVGGEQLQENVDETVRFFEQDKDKYKAIIATGKSAWVEPENKFMQIDAWTFPEWGENRYLERAINVAFCELTEDYLKKLQGYFKPKPPMLEVQWTADTKTGGWPPVREVFFRQAYVLQKTASPDSDEGWILRRVKLSRETPTPSYDEVIAFLEENDLQTMTELEKFLSGEAPDRTWRPKEENQARLERLVGIYGNSWKKKLGKEKLDK
jgi:hypothetical protein